MRRDGSDDVLFFGASLGDALRANDERLREFVLNLDGDVALSTPEQDLVDRIYEQFHVDCPRLRKEDQHSPGAEDTQIDVTGDFRRVTFGPGPHYVRGTRFRLFTPFDGDGGVFKLQPSRYSLNPPRAQIVGQELVIGAEAPADSLDPESMRKQLDSELSQIEKHLERARSEIDAYNASLEDKARNLLKRRRDKVLADRKLEDHLAVRVTRRSDQSPSLAVDVPRKRREVRVGMPGTAKPFKPEPTIGADDYSAITEAIVSFGRAAERFPETFHPMSEEVLREVLLVILNNQFGPSVGEMFSRIDKTDVAILHEDGAVFISECKIWKGEASFKKAVDQLLGYLVWRDTKAALILFVKSKDISGITQKAIACIEAHERFKRRGPYAAGQAVFVLHHEGDTAREIDVALIIVPIPESTSSGPEDGT